MMESNSIGYLTNLLNSIKKKRLVLFVGSGISIYPPANLPAGGMVTKLLKRKLQELDCFDRYKNKSNYLHNIWEEPYGPSFEAILELAPDKNKVLKFLRELYFNCNPNNIHLFIAELLRKELIQVVITTNYDSCIEKAYKQLTNMELLTIYLENHYKNQKLHSSLPFLFKIHGSIEGPEQEIIFSLYQEGQELIGWKKELLKEIISGKEILFLGYSGYDFDIGPMLAKSTSEVPINKCYWSIHENEKTPKYKKIWKRISPEGKRLLSRLQGELFGDTNILLSDISIDFCSLNPYAPIELTPDEREKQERQVEQLFDCIFHDDDENHIWFIKLLNKMGVGRDALQQCFYLLNKWRAYRNTINEEKLSILQKEVGQALFHIGKYEKASKWFKEAERTAGKTRTQFFSIFNLRMDFIEAIRCQRKYFTYALALIQAKLLVLFYKFRESSKELLPSKAVLFQREAQLIQAFYPKVEASKIRFVMKILEPLLVSRFEKAKNCYAGYGDLFGVRDIEYRLYKLGLHNGRESKSKLTKKRETKDIGSELTIGYERVGYAIGRINNLRERAKKLLNLKDFSGAERLIKSSIGLAEEIGDFPGCAKGYKILSKALQGQNRNEEAKKALTKAYYYLQELEVKYVDRPTKLENILEKITFD